ncbi:uncharacterized protein BCR38DRAFT_408852 [Pseudomassariella vexata]|uniref:GST N-terminal domain-containing protein n=1 Tax=Pseudomassariella vexata TaxID=1141098 RepID=A0A1Y2E0U8_9PEZI|nr:uncharacterized protein BCR38DRAFT_408852 [Pseudomassariella vexata]ORY65109.1 hypothetical protein BCR38DRAFT_408852 [Pseudomassariella vexata]
MTRTNKSPHGGASSSMSPLSSSSGNILSETLREITTTKLEELSKRRTEFVDRKTDIVARLHSENDRINRLTILCDGVKACFAVKTDKTGKVIRGHTKTPDVEIELKNLDSFLAQARYDPSVSTKTFDAWENSLLRHLETQSLRFEYASLYAQLVTEWLSTEEFGSHAGNSDESAEYVPSKRKLESRLEWERSVFEPAIVDVQKLEEYLAQLFQDGKGQTKPKAKASKQLADEIASFEMEMSSPNQFTPSSLNWVIQGLLDSELLSDEKREVLKNFKTSQVMLTEVSDVLNMRITGLAKWSWGESVPVEQRRKISGGYNIHMHEDLLQAIFLQHIGVKWSVFLKGAFRRFRKLPGPWIDVRSDVPNIDRKRLGYYLGPMETKPSVQHTRRSMYRKNYFVAHLLDSECQTVEALDGEEEAEIVEACQVQTNQIPRRAMAAQPAMNSFSSRFISRGGAKRYRKVPSDAHPEESESDIESDDSTTTKKPMEAKQRLLHLLSAEIAINTRIHGEITVFRSVFDSWNSLLPHATLRTVLSFLGVSATWLEFFVKFLEAPLRFVGEDEDANPARTRRRGVPANHALSEVFGEVVLFCLDFSINQSTTGSLLYRLHDEFWFWSPNHKIAVTAWKAIQDFATVTGTDLNPSKTGTVRISGDPNVSLSIDASLPNGPICWGFLQLSPESGRFEINQKMVDSHIEELRKQLHGKQNSIFAFIQTWNTYAATFFASNFGKPANCFGRNQVDQMLATHSRIQREIFKEGSNLRSHAGGNANNVVEYIKSVLGQRFGVSNIPDAYLFFPVELGGLDLRSPFISTLQIRDSVIRDPSQLLDAFEEAEMERYGPAKTAFEKGDTKDERYALEDPDWEPVEQHDRDTFMSFQEFTRWREEFQFGFDNELHDVYQQLLQQPEEESLEISDGIANGLSSLGQQSNASGIRENWDSMEPYWRWVTMLYGPEMIERFGGLKIVDAGLLPMGMMGIRNLSQSILKSVNSIKMAASPKIKLYTNHLCPWAHRVHIALSELQVPFEEEIIDLTVPRTQEYLRVNPRGLVPSLEYRGEIITESAIVSTFLADVFPSSLLPASTDPKGPLTRARIGFFVDTYFSKPHASFVKVYSAKSDEEVNAFMKEYVNVIAKEVEPLLKDAAPFFGGSEKLTLAEVLIGSFIIRLYTFPKHGLLSQTLLSDLAEQAPNFDKWAKVVAQHPSVTGIYNEQEVVDTTKARLAKARA